MSRNILAIVGILFCSASAMGQDFVAPKINPVIQSNTSGFQPPSNPAFTPVKQDQVEIQEPKIEEKPIIIPTKSENKATIQPAPRIRAVPINQPIQTNDPINNQEQNVDTLRPQPPVPEQNQFDLKPQQETPVQSTIIQPAPNQAAPNQATIELPEPKKEIQTVELKEDTQTYRSSGYNKSGVSEYQLAVARERARARRMRMEVKKWYGIDSARPVVSTRGNIGVYSNYYNGVPSRFGHHYGNPYYNSANFYFHVPVSR